MVAAIVLVFVILVLIPVGFLVSTMAAAGVIGALLKDDAEEANAGSELIDCNY